MKYLLCIGIIFFTFNIAKSQTAPINCPEGYVCITREAAKKALEDSDARIALEAQVKANEAAFAEQKALLKDMTVKFAEVSGENTQLKQNAVQDRAIIELLLKNSKKKCYPFSICIG